MGTSWTSGSKQLNGFQVKRRRIEAITLKDYKDRRCELDRVLGHLTDEGRESRLVTPVAQT